MRYVGVDVSATRGFHVAVLAGSGRLQLHRAPDAGAVAALVAPALPACVTVDAPAQPGPTLNLGIMADPVQRARLPVPPPPGRYLNFRVAEYECRRRGLAIYPTVPGRVAGWVRAGLDVYAALGALGLRLPSHAADRAATLLEIYPALSFTALAGRLLPRKSTPAGLAARRRVLAEHGITVDSDAHDDLDAAVAALSGRRYREGAATLLGHPAEGLLLVPAAPLPEQWAWA